MNQLKAPTPGGVRYIVSSNAAGKSQLQVEMGNGRVEAFESLPGFSARMLWAAPPTQVIQTGPVEDTAANPSSWVPLPGGSNLLIVTFPPDAEMAREGFDPAQFGAEFQARLPGLAESFEADGSGMHRTDTVDYDVVLDGEMVLELDDGCTLSLCQHDVVVQLGTRHAWRNVSSRPATMLFVLNGASRSSAPRA